MRILLCGNGDFGIPSLKAVLSSKHEVAGIVTQPARPAGRGGKLRATAIAQCAADLGLEATQCDDVNSPEAIGLIRPVKPDVIFVVDFGQFVSRTVRELAPLGAFNLHGSLLPDFRGAAPVNWAIIRGHAKTGVTTFSLVDRMDAGPVYAAQETDISPDETADQLRERLAALGAGLVCKTLDMLESGETNPVSQDESRATRASKLRKSDGWVDFSDDVVAVRNLVHGTWPWPGGQARYVSAGQETEQLVTIARAAAVDGQCEPGLVNTELLVGTGKGLLRILKIRPAGRRLMHWQDFVNGYRVRPGDKFVRPG